MICRARPKYYIVDEVQKGNVPVLTEYSTTDDSFTDGMYFNGGSLAFEFFLHCYNGFYQKKARVAIQSFTCRTMLDAIVNSGSIALIYDVKLEDASLSFASVEGEDVDIVVLTCYQGVPNQEYLRFSEYCREKGILLFEDLSHGAESRVDHVKLGTLGNAYIESYTFDKPCSAMCGGKLVLVKLDNSFQQFIDTQYQLLSEEEETAAKRDLAVLEFLMEYTKEENYYEAFDYSVFHQARWLIPFWNKTLFQIAAYRKGLLILWKIVRRFSKAAGHTTCRRMHPVKVDCIRRQDVIRMKKQEQSNYTEMLNIRQGNPFERENTEIVWNRYSVVDTDGLLEEMLRENGLCVGHYNWPQCLHDLTGEYSSETVVLREDCKNTEYLKNHVLNVPVWQFGFQESGYNQNDK